MLNARSLIQRSHKVSRTRPPGGFQFDQLSDCPVFKHLWVSLFIPILDFGTKHKRLVVIWTSRNCILTLSKDKLVWAWILIAAVFVVFSLMKSWNENEKTTFNSWRWNWLLPRPRSASVAIIATSLYLSEFSYFYFVAGQSFAYISSQEGRWGGGG